MDPRLGTKKGRSPLQVKRPFTTDIEILLSDKNKSLDQMNKGAFVRGQASRIVQIDDSNLYK